MTQDSCQNMAARTERVAPFQVMALLAEAQALQAVGKDIIHLEVGQPDFTTPEPIARAGMQAIADGYTGYTPALGLPALREKVAGWYQSRFGVTVDPRRVALTPGASGALLLLAAARLERGDQLMLADPGYPCNRHFAALFDAHGQLVPAGPDDRYQLTPAMIDQHWSATTKAALVASPANPTGTVLSLQELAALHQAVGRQGGELWVDEIYQGLNFTAEPQTVLSVADDAVVLNSFSKYFGMTGWRLGWTVVPESWVETLDTLAQNVFLAPSTIAQYAAMAAFDDDSVAIMEERRQILAERREYLLQALPELGFKVPVAPDGAFYVYADASQFTDSSLEFCLRALRETGVAFTPGVDFGEAGALTHVRFAFTADIERLKVAMERLADWLKTGQE